MMHRHVLMKILFLSIYPGQTRRFSLERIDTLSGAFSGETLKVDLAKRAVINLLSSFLYIRACSEEKMKKMQDPRLSIFLPNTLSGLL